ncbi:MAG: phosphopantetheine-binding protein [Polyangiaceae bacterium]
MGLLDRSVLLRQVFEKYWRDARNMPAYVIRRKGVRYLEGLALSSLYLRACDSVGKRARVRGAPFIENLGRIQIGDDFNFVSLFVQSHLVTGHAGFLEIGNTVNINFGAAISAHEHVRIGDRVRIGPYAIIMDTDYHAARDRNERPTSPITIGDDVWLAGRVSVLKGSSIGAGSVIAAGSVVSGEIPAGVIAAGVPARVLRSIEPGKRDDTTWSIAAQQVEEPVRQAVPVALESAATDAPAAANDEIGTRVKAIVATTFGIDGPVQEAWGPSDIPRWDSLGQLRLTVALEDAFSVNLSEDDMVKMTSVGEICRIVRATQA